MILPSLKGNNKKTIRIIAGAGAFILVSFAVQQFYLRQPPFEEVMSGAAGDLNKNCALFVSQQMKLDKVVALPDNAFSYDYSLINYEKSEINADTLKKYIEPCVLHDVATNPDMQNLRNNKVTITYSYMDKNGVLVYTFMVTPDKYSSI